MLAPLLAATVFAPTNVITKDWLSGQQLVITGDAYSVSPEETRILTETEYGAITARHQFSQVFDDVQGEWIFPAADFVIFRKWFYEAIDGGTQWFPLRLPLGLAVDESCTNCPTHQCFFRGKPAWTAVRKGGNWFVKADLRVRVR